VVANLRLERDFFMQAHKFGALPVV